MVKSRFPGKPSKHFNRRKVSVINNEDSDGVKEAEDVYRRLSVFNMLFSTEDEDNSFHGFSPHETDEKTRSPSQKSTRGSKKFKRKQALSNSPRKQISPVSTFGKDTSEKHGTSSLEQHDDPDLDIVKVPVSDTLQRTCDEIKVSDKVDNKDDLPINPTLSGKFVLPSRSAHSSRVIKPNKRFLQSEVSVIPNKRSRLKYDVDGDKNFSDSVLDQKIEFENGGSHLNICDKKLKKTVSSSAPKSPVKFILRKPRLKIKSQPLSTMGGPFSSPGANSLSLQNLRYKSPGLTKVCCGVCGSFRTYRFFKQARKFGIFSCEPCRRFILRIIKFDREKSLKPLICNSGTGSCPIRQSTLIGQPFSNETLETSSTDELTRCEACWLNLCLRSFHMPQRLSKRLSLYLPLQITQKTLISFDKCPTSNWSDPKKTADIAVEDQNLASTTDQQRIPRRNRILRENINIRRGSNTSLRLSSHRGRGYNSREEDVGRKGRTRQKLPLTGPRVKHVCRSASLVLGQPAATFLPSGPQQSSGSQNGSDESEMADRQETISVDTDTSDTLSVEKGKKTPDRDYAVNNNNDVDYPPIARMLQDLGRANCELLDGMENHELEKQNARVAIDFWESYDPEEVSQMGFPLIGYNPLKLRALCFLCGSAGLEKMLHCSSCCEPYHMFCVSNSRAPSLNQTSDWWRIDWLCPKCTLCEACMKTGGSQLYCSICHKSYHSVCTSTIRANMSDSTWVCPSCLFCKSCNDTSVYLFVGNMPLCKACFKLRKKGNFCPLCQCCYDDNDYNTKMMECAECKCWIHAQCEGISNEKYQVLSYLPSSVEFICKLCCKKPPAPWALAVDAELRAGYLNVIKILSKNRNTCALLKASPKKQHKCTCLNKSTAPIHLQNLMSSSETLQIESVVSPEQDIKTPDLGLLTPKLTKDDEESLKTVKSDFLKLVSENKVADRNYSVEKELAKKPLPQETTNDDRTQLLSIAFDRVVQSNDMNVSGNLQVKDNNLSKDKSNFISEEKVCTCKLTDKSVSQPLSLLTIKNKASADEYRSVSEFHKDMEFMVNEIGMQDLVDTYNRCLKQIFPWFDSNDSGMNDSIISGVDTPRKSSSKDSNKQIEKSTTNQEQYPALKGLLNFEPDYYYIGANVQDTRHCLFCKGVGEGEPMKEGRLLYCGQNDWVHANCAMWSSEVFEEIDGSLQNVHSAISRARLIRCYECGKKGASLGCCAKSCPTAYHFICAHLANCVFLDNKEIYCKAHISLKGDTEIHREEDFHIRRSVYVELDNKKRKDVLRNEVRLYIGSLEVNQIGEIFPELSDESDMIIPCEFKCSRLYWSSKEPWKIVKYSIQTKITNLIQEYTCENDTNFTIDHSLEITPPPSPVDSVKNDNCINSKFLEKDVRTVVNHLLDKICLKEEDGNLSDQQNADLLPPEIKDAIFEDLPQDFLDRISVHDIFTKMSFDDIMCSDSKSDTGDGMNLDPVSNKLKNSSGKAIEKVNQAQNNLYKMVRVVKQRKLEKIKECESFLERENRNKWKRQSILQVDGAMDLSESDQSNDSCDVEMREESNDDKPVKCGRCHRTYRTLISYDRHLSTCNVDYPSCSESDLSEEEKTQSIPDENSNKSESVITVVKSSASQTIDPEVHMFNGPIELKTISANEQKVQTALVQNSFENTVLCMENYNGLRDSSESIVNLNYSTLNGNGIHNSSFTTNEQTLVTASIDPVTDSVVGLQTPTIIVQQVPSNENLLPTYMPSTYQEHSQQPGIHYITAINTQEKAQFLSANSMGQNTYHIQSPIGQPTTVVQNVPTVVGTIIQANGVEQYLLNNTAQNVDIYSHQNNMYIANQPMIVGMETVVSNTVMSSSRFISGSAPGPVLASSYSATTTQVFQAAKPMVDIPQGYLLLNTNPPQLVTESNSPCIQNVIQNGTLTSSPSWNSYKIDYQDSIKSNKNITYQAMSQQIMSQKQEVNGVKLFNANEQSLYLTPIAMKPSRAAPKAHIGENTVNKTILPVSQSVITLTNNNLKSNSLVKVVELPSSSAVYKEKPQQAVAPVVIKKIPSDSVRRMNDVKTIATNHTKGTELIFKEMTPVTITKPGQKNEKMIEHIIKKTTKQNYISDIPISKPEKSHPTTSKTIEKKIPTMPKPNGLDHNRKRKIVHEEPKISFEITSEDGFSYSTTNINEAWTKVFETVQFARKARNLPPLAQNPFSSPDSMLKKLMGLGNNSMKYLLEQLPGISSCSKYKPVYHRKTLSALEKELSRGGGLNPSGCARTEKYHHCQKTYDMFSWLASRHRRPPKLLSSDSDGVNGNSRRATSMNLPMAMRFRHLKETSRVSVGVFRSDIHGRGLFCLRDIDAGEMVIEYAGEVIRSALTDKRERYYTEKGIGCYMFRIDDKSVVDATMKGNAARFINHSCEPNCYSRVIDILGKKHILIFALRRILQGEELTYDYKFPLEEEKINCHCLSRKCRKYLN